MRISPLSHALMLRADLAYDIAATAEPDPAYLWPIRGKATDFEALCSYDAAAQRLTIGIAGSKSDLDWRVNRDALPRRVWEWWVDVSGAPRSQLPGMWHSGYSASVASALEDSTLRQYLSQAREAILCGHSQGGGEAGCLAGRLVARYPELHVELHTFGAPAFCTPKACRFLEDHLAAWWRWEYELDGVPFLPVPFPFPLLWYGRGGQQVYVRHRPQYQAFASCGPRRLAAEVWQALRTGGWDLKRDHSRKHYLAATEALVGRELLP